MYSFNKINEDTYELTINDKKFTFTRTIDIAKELQSVDLYTTYYVAEFLADRGETLDNTKLRVERKENGKTIVDESNLEALKKQASNMAYYDILNKIFKKTIGLTYIETMRLLGITENAKEVERFISEFTNILINGILDNTPREQNT